MVKVLNRLDFILKPDFKTYYNINTPLSYNDVYLLLLIGARGTGKTTGVMWYCCNRFQKYGEEFAYVRRYKSELKKCKSLLDKIIGGVSVKGLGEGAFQYEVNRKRVGYGLALSVQQSFKSGINGSKVTNIIFDEGVLVRGGTYRYLDNEVEMFFELISTIVRQRDDYKIWILGNNLDIFNPYYEYFKIPRFDKRYVDKERGIYCEELPTSEYLLAMEENTPLYKISKGTTYHDYHYGNKILVKEKVCIGNKDPKAPLLCRIVYNSCTLNIYGLKGYKMYVEYRDKIINDKYSYIIMENNKPNYLFAKVYRDSNIKKYIDICYYQKDTIYNSEKASAVMSTFMEII